jgi:Glycosyl hydrolase family 12
MLVAGGLVAASLPAASSEAAALATKLCQQQTHSVDGSAYTVENNEWGSSAPECITTDGGTGFAVANSAIANSTYGAPGGYTAIYKGCHWGACTPGSGFPVRVSDIRDGTVTTSWSTSQPGGSSDYDVAYDIWFNQTPTTTGQPNGTELMIWLNHNGPVQPFGSRVASNVSVGGRGYNVWYGNQGWNTVSYTMTSGTTSVSNLDLQPVIADAVKRGYISPSWYLIDVEAGFEMWQGGAGLATNSFAVKVAGAGASSPSMVPASPASPSATPSNPASPSATPTSQSSSPSSPPPPPGPAPSAPASPPATSAPDISLQAISPDPPTSGTSTNVTLDFKNLGTTAAANLTLVTEIVNSAGNVVGSESQTGQNVAPQQTLNQSYAWTAAPQAGTYTIEGLVQDSSGKTLEHAQVGTVTVK